MQKEIKLIAHQNNLNLLVNKFSGNFPHSWIFSGIKGIGKYETALQFIKTVYGDNKNFGQKVFKINDDMKIALIDDIRALINQISLTNSDDKTKSFIIIDNANSLNFNSFNALLKTIEEPPKNTVIIIICHDMKNIPKTIVSRCINLNFRPLNINELEAYCNFMELNIDKIYLNKHYHLINGSIEKLLLLINKDGEFVKQTLDEILDSKVMNISKFEKFYNLISKDYSEFFKLIFNIIFEKQKNRFIQSSNKNQSSTKILNYFSKVNSFTSQNLNIGNKKELFFLLSEYISTNNNEI